MEKYEELLTHVAAHQLQQSQSQLKVKYYHVAVAAVEPTVTFEAPRTGPGASFLATAEPPLFRLASAVCHHQFHWLLKQKRHKKHSTKATKIFTNIAIDIYVHAFINLQNKILSRLGLGHLGQSLGLEAEGLESRESRQIVSEI